MEPSHRPVRDIGHVRLIPERDTRTIWNTGLLGWVSLAVFALMLFVLGQLIGVRNDLQSVVTLQSDDLARIQTQVQQLRSSVKELTQKLEAKQASP